MDTNRIDNSRSILLAKNSFGRNVKSRKRFLRYFNLLVEQTKEGELEERVSALKEAELSLDIYSEKTWLNDAKINEIQILKESLTDITTNIDSDIEAIKRQISQEEQTEEAQRLQREKEHNEKLLKERISHNDDILLSLEHLHSVFASTQLTKEEFDDLLKRLGVFENNLNKEDFTEEQTKRYGVITDKFSKSVSEIMSRFNSEEEKEYNQKALAAIKEVYDSFKEDEKKYKKYWLELEDLVKELFSFETGRLAPEVQMYYNQVYSFIFSKLDDEQKFKLTELSLQKFDI